MAAKTATIIFKGEDQISPAIKGATASVGGLNTVLTQTATESGNAIRDKLVKEVEAARAKIGEFSKQGLKVEAGQALGAFNKLNNELKKLDAGVGNASNITSEALLKANLQAQALGQLVGKLNELKTAAVDAFGEFRKAQRNAAAQATDITGLSAAVKSLGSELKNQVSATELLDNAARVAQKGYRDTADNINVLRATQKLAIATNTDFNTALEATTDILKAYNLPSSEADKITAQLAATARLAGTSVNELAPQIGRIASTAASAGIGINELLGFLGNASKKSGDARGNITALNKVINDLSTGDLVKKGNEIGLSFDQAALKTGGLNELFKQLRSQGITTAEGLQKLGFNAKEAAAIAPSLATGINEIKDAQAGLNKQVETQIDPKKSAENQLKDSLVELGKTIAPIANKVVELTRNMIAAFNSLDQPVKVVLGTLLGTGGLIFSVGLLGSTILEGAKIIKLSVGALKAFDLALAATNITSKAVAISNAIVGTSIAGTGVAASGATLGIGAFTASLGTLALASAAVLVPLAAIGGALVLKEKIAELKEYNAAVEENVATGQQLSNQTSGLISKLQSLQSVREKGGEITDEQIRKEKGTLKLTEDQIEAEKEKLAQIEAQKAPDADKEKARQVEIATRKKTIALAEKEKKELEDLITANKGKTTANLSIARSEKDVENAVKSRVEAEKRGNEETARARVKAFEKGAKAKSGNFEDQARADQQAFEKQINAEKKAFDDAQKTDKDQFEKGLLAEQRTFNEGEKSKDAQYQKTKQEQERAFNAAQQADKEAFDKRQQDASRAFDAKQNADKVTAETQFSQRRLEIERKLQLDAANPQDRAKLEAEFAAADAKAAKEKEAFAQLKADEEAFAKKQQADKVAFEESQKLAAQTFEKQQQSAKLVFDDAIKLKDQEYEKQKEASKLAFEDILKAKRDKLEAGQSATKLAFEKQLELKKQEFEDVERKKKKDFDAAQNLEKADFEDAERKKKQAFEDNLKALESQFKADERAKDLANAQQVAAIKNATPASAIASKIPALAGIGVKPLATGGRFKSGEQLLVGERGAELVKFGSSGLVTNAADTKQILGANNFSSSTMSTAKMEGLLTQLVGKLDRPNISVSSQNDQDTLIKIQREIGRSAAMSL